MITERMYKIELETIEPLRIGGPEDPLSGIHNPVAMVGDKVAVPGSSLKGALRFAIEQFLIDSHYDKESKSWPDTKLGFQPCIPATKFSDDEKALVDSKKYRNETCHYPCESDERKGKDNKTVLIWKCTKRGKAGPHSICPVCYFLGTMGLGGFVRVPFLYSEISPSELYSSRIDRARSTVVTGTNRPYQLIPSATKFTGNLMILFEDTILGWQLGKPRPISSSDGDKWLEDKNYSPEEVINTYIIERLKAIKILGGYKSKGFGQVRIDVIP